MIVDVVSKKLQNSLSRMSTAQVMPVAHASFASHTDVASMSRPRPTAARTTIGMEVEAGVESLIKPYSRVQSFACIGAAEVPSSSRHHQDFPPNSLNPERHASLSECDKTSPSMGGRCSR